MHCVRSLRAAIFRAVTMWHTAQVDAAPDTRSVYSLRILNNEDERLLSPIGTVCQAGHKLARH